MRYEIFKSSWLKNREEKHFLRYSVLLLLLLNMFSIFGLLRKDTAVILVPPGLSDKAEVTLNAASQGYKESWGVYVASLLGNVTPENADFVLKSLSGMVSGEISLTLTEQIAKELEMLKEEKVSSVFVVRGVSYESETDKVFVFGSQKLIGVALNPAKMPENNQTFEFIIDIRGYSPVITHMATYLGGPKTADLVAKEEEMRKSAEQVPATTH